jgi:hypothetical protein
VLDKMDSDRWADIYSDMLGVDPQLIVPSEQVALVRQARAEQQQKQQQMEQAQQSSVAVKNLAGADTSGQNALTDVTKMFSGYTGA